jgi:hypothetical protein
MPRAGTSWVGKMLEASGRLVYINEPLNTAHPPGGSPGVLRAPVRYRFQYITDENEQDYVAAFDDLFRLRYHVRAELARNRSPRDLLRMAKYVSSFVGGRMRGKRPLLDDPFAVFSVPWLVRRFDSAAIVVVRHPAAIAASRKRLGSRTDFSQLLMQPLLMRDRLEPFRADMEAMLRCPDDVIGHACLLWRMIYAVVASDGERSAGLAVVRHEDLSMDPISAFTRLYARLDLPFGDSAKRTIVRASTGGDGTSAHSWSISRGGVSRTGFRRLDSRSNVDRWKRLLMPAEVARVRELTDDVGSRFYTPADWD